MNVHNQVKGAPVLGAVVMWDGLRRCDRKQLDDALAGAQLDSGKLPLPPTDGDALRRAMELRFSGGDGRSLDRWTVKALPPLVRGEVAFALLRHFPDASGALALAETVEIRLPAGLPVGTEPAVVVTPPDPLRGDLIRKALRSGLADARTQYLVRDVRAWLVRQVARRATGYPLRDGVYFVLAERLPELEKIDAVLRLAGAGELVRFDVVDDAAAREAAAKAASLSLQEELYAVLAGVRGLRDGERLRAGSIAARSVDVIELKERAEFLERVLGVSTDSVRVAVGECQRMLLELGGTKAAPAAAVAP